MTEKFLSWVQIEKNNNYFLFFIYYNISSSCKKLKLLFLILRHLMNFKCVVLLLHSDRKERFTGLAHFRLN